VRSSGLPASPVRTTKKHDLDRDGQDFTLKLGPDIKGFNMRQPNGNWAGMDTEYDVAMELWTLGLQLAVEGLETEKCLDIDGELDWIDPVKQLRTKTCQWT